MAHYAESQASFRARALQVQLKEEHVSILERNDVRCFNNLAFAVCGQPGQLDQAKFQEVLDLMCPSGASLGITASLRQLSYEALTVAVAAIRQRVEAPDETKKLPPQEKDARLKQVQASITGFEIAGVFEPAHAVIDAYAQMLEEGAMRLLPLSKCISRELELSSVKQDQQVVLLEGSKLQVKNKALDLSMDLGTEMKVMQAFVRRGLALEMSGLASYSVHNKITNEFMVHITRDPPPGFRQPGLDAILRADKHLWTKVIDKVRSNLRPDEQGKLPIDKALMEMHMQADVLFFLLPVPLSQSQAARTSSHDSKPAKTQVATKKDTKHMKRPMNRNRPKLPSGLHNLKPTNAKGQRICFNYNLAHGCNNECEKDGDFEKCTRGMHQCMKCHGRHSLVSCRKN